MAIRVKHDPGDETWAVFVRRFGNEGFCSNHQHYLDDLLNDTFTFRLPWRPGASDVGVHPSTVFESRLGQATRGLAVAKNQGVLLSFTMAVPPHPLVPGEMVNGEPVARAVPDPQKDAMDQQRLDALHAVYGSEIPEFPTTRVRITPRPRVP